MIATLAQLHIDVVEVKRFDSTLAKGWENGQILTVKTPIVLLLLLSKTNFYDSFFQWRDWIFYFVFQSPQKVRLQDCMQFINLVSFLQVTILAHEFVEIVELVGLEVIKQRE